MPPSAIIPTQLTVDASNRLALPKHLTERILWMVSKEEINAWVLEVSAGRFRLLSDEIVRSDALLDSLRSMVHDGRSAEPSEPTFVFSAERAALTARLLPISLKPPPPMWRFGIPKALQLLLPTDCKQMDFTMLFSTEGYWEVWHTEILRRAVSAPFPLGNTGTTII